MSIEKRIGQLEHHIINDDIELLDFIIVRGDNYPGPLKEFECRQSDVPPQKPGTYRILWDQSRYD